MKSTNKGPGVVFLAIAGIFVTIVVVVGGNSLSSSSLGTVEGKIVKQWEGERCRTRKSRRNRRSLRRRRVCTIKYNNKVELSDGSHQTFDIRSWHDRKQTGDIVTLDKRKGGMFGDVYYKPSKR